MLLLPLLGLSIGQAASLDNIEVAGLWGSPTATTPAALWWNPAGIALGGGHQLLLEIAPTSAVASYDRADPHGGSDQIALTGAVPYLGVSSDLTVPGLGLGAALAVPHVRGGAEVDEPGAGRYHLRQGDIRAIDAILSTSYAWRERVSIGIAAHSVHSSWAALLDNDSMPDLYDEIIRQGQQPDEDIYTDENLENERYAALLDLGPLTGTAWTWSIGTQVRPHERVEVGLAYIAGYRLDHSGDAVLNMSCPPQEDVAGRFGSESFGLCDATLQADASIGYQMPARVHAGLAVRPLEHLRVELMGAWVGWSVFQDFEINVGNVAAQNPSVDPEAAPLVEQQRLWARDNHDAWFAALDVRGELGERWMLAGRLTRDNAAVPDEALSTNNFDADVLMAGGLVTFDLTPAVSLGLSGTQYFATARTVTNSSFGMTLDPESRNEDRYFYPHANGTYDLTLSRLGLAVQVHL